MAQVSANKEQIKIILPEGRDNRIQEVANRFANTNITPILVFRTKAELPQNQLANHIESIIIEDNDLETLASELVTLRNGKMSQAEAEKLVHEPNYFATLWVKKGLADGLVGGINYDTKDILRPALQIIKPKKGVSLVSSFFLMVRQDETYIFTDCALNIDPDPEQLSHIAQLGYEAAQMFNFATPRIALLSYSTKGSGAGASVEKVRAAYNILKAQGEITCQIDGEFQFDAAWDNQIRAKKAPHSSLEDRANVYVFPNLDAGNIGYKIAQRMGGFEAVGPILIGLDKPVNDLSRGATIDDIYNTILVTAYSAMTAK